MRLFSSFPLVRLPLKRRENGLKLFSPWGRQIEKAATGQVAAFCGLGPVAWDVAVRPDQLPVAT